MKFGLRVLVGLALVGIVACSPAGAPPPGKEGVSGPAASPKSSKPEGKVTAAVEYLGNEILDPGLLRSSADKIHQDALFDSLFGGDLKGRVAAGIASSWTVSTDGKTWDIKLRNDVKFHNGTALTAQDAKFSLVRTMDPAKKNYMGPTLARLIEGVEAPDDCPDWPSY